ncbi:50S ribosomal protein L39e [Thermoplasmatales archaeon AK]|nr:50S ribosomal protein L39e [Thermoplasmatales archaeon AK]
MSRNKELGRKLRLLKKVKENRRVPGWVMMRTARRVTQNPKRRSWRRSSLKL